VEEGPCNAPETSEIRMRVLMDEHPCDVAAATVGEAVAAAARIAEERGRLIVEVVVDGSSWSETDLASERGGLTLASEIRMQTAQPVELVCQTFRDAREALLEADDLQRGAAEMIESGKTAGAMDKLHGALNIWQSVQQALVMGSQVLDLKLEEETLSGRLAAPVSVTINRLNQQLRLIRDALQNNDPLGLSDTLMYDLPIVLDEWRTLLDDLQTHLKAAR
jgi:hypothetical protein